MLTSQTIEAILSDALKEFTFSGSQLVAVRGNSRVDLSQGYTSHFEESEPVTGDTLFDIGSLTKVVVTTSCLARAYERKEIDLTDSLSKFASAFAKSPVGRLSLGEILSHSSGLAAWEPIYEEVGTGKLSLEEWFLKHENKIFRETGKAVYSDLNFLLLGFILKKIWGGIDEAFQAEVVKPLKLSGVGFLPMKGSFAATEYDSRKKRTLVGEVFDENTRALGGTSSHAGLFAKATALEPWCRAWLESRLGQSSWISQRTAELFTRKSGRVSGSSWAYGWDTKSAAFSSAGQYLSLETFGHLGYPGTSVWVDPVAKGYVILFTNRIHPSRADERIKRLRPAVHDAVARLWGLA